LAAENDQLMASCLDKLPDMSQVRKSLKMANQPGELENVSDQNEDIEFLMHPPPEIKTWKKPHDMKHLDSRNEPTNLSDDTEGKKLTVEPSSELNQCGSESSALALQKNLNAKGQLAALPVKRLHSFDNVQKCPLLTEQGLEPGTPPRGNFQNLLVSVSCNLKPDTLPSRGLLSTDFNSHSEQKFRFSKSGAHPMSDSLDCKPLDHVKSATHAVRSQHNPESESLSHDQHKYPKSISSDRKPRIRPKPEFPIGSKPKEATTGVKPKTYPKPEILVHSRKVTNDEVMPLIIPQESNQSKHTEKKDIENNKEATSAPGNPTLLGMSSKKPRTHPKPLSLDILKRFEDVRY
jgi:hypothetical protein